MNIKLLTEHYLQFLSLQGGCTGSSESTLLEITCRGSYVYDPTYIAISHLPSYF